MRRIGVCSWSLLPEGPEDLARKVQDCGLTSVQLALDPIREEFWDTRTTQRILREARITIASGMIGMFGEDYSTLESIRQTGGLAPDRHWARNLHAAQASTRIASEFGIRLVTLHAGFLPEDRTDPRYATMIDRLRTLADTFAEHGIAVALETGQETAATLESVLSELVDVGVNFDPANMLLYGSGDPIESIERLWPWVRQVHIKDALASRVPGEWGQEVRVGEGEVDWMEFFRVLDARVPECDLMIEREAGLDRIEDVRAASDLIRRITQTGEQSR